jgi:hypothetical protein
MGESGVQGSWRLHKGGGVGTGDKDLLQMSCTGDGRAGSACPAAVG